MATLAGYHPFQDQLGNLSGTPSRPIEKQCATQKCVRTPNDAASVVKCQVALAPRIVHQSTSRHYTPHRPTCQWQGQAMQLRVEASLRISLHGCKLSPGSLLKFDDNWWLNEAFSWLARGSLGSTRVSFSWIQPEGQQNHQKK
jgi:hypothetical protein